MYRGNEPFTSNKKPIGLHTIDFWLWAYSDMNHAMNRAVLAEYIVYSAVESTEVCREVFRPFDVQTNSGLRIEVKSAAYTNAHNTNHSDCVTFRIAPARLPDAFGDYKDDAPLQRNCDVYVFCVFTGVSPYDSPLNLDLWEFYVMATTVLNKAKPTQKTITLPSLKSIGAMQCEYSELKSCIFKAVE